MNEDFDKLVFYAICESLYLQKSKTNYISFDSMCSNMYDSLMNNLTMDGHIYKVMTKTMEEISTLYGFNESEMAEYISMFVVGKEWEQYKEFVMILVQNTQNSFQ